MNLKFLNTFLILFFPDKIFKKIIKEDTPLNTLISLLIAALFFSGIGMFVYKKMIMPKIIIFWPVAGLIILSVFFLFILITAVVSLVTDNIYMRAFKVKGKNLTSDFFSNFLAHAQVIPFWLFMVFLHVIFYTKKIPIVCIFIFICMIIRLLDVESRLVKAVYRLTLIQSYVTVFIQFVSIVLGMGICAYLINI